MILPHTLAADVPAEAPPATGEVAGTAAPATGEDAESAPPAGAGALIVAERVRAAISGHAFPGHGGRRYAHTTITVGVADLRADDDSAALIAAADAALYEGKRAGRDQVVVRDR